MISNRYIVPTAIVNDNFFAENVLSLDSFASCGHNIALNVPVNRQQRIYKIYPKSVNSILFNNIKYQFQLYVSKLYFYN